jgi:hypothetical protein
MCYWENVITEDRRAILDQAREEIRAARRAMQRGQGMRTGQPLDAAMERAQSLELKIAHTPEQAAELLADEYEKKWGFTEKQTREGMIQNQLKAFRANPVPEDFKVDVINSICDQIERGAAEPFPVVIHGERPGFNDVFIGGEHTETYISMIYHPKPSVSDTADILGQMPATAANTYANKYGGIYVHEWGHEVHTRDDALLKRAMAEMERIDESKEKRQWVKRNISYYSVTNSRELAAEVYTVRQHPGFAALDDSIKQFVWSILRQ